MDAVIRWALATHPGLLLIAPVERNQRADHPLSSAEASQKDHQLCAETLEQVIVQPSNPAAEDASSFSGITAQLLIILNFMAQKIGEEKYNFFCILGLTSCSDGKGRKMMYTCFFTFF